MIIPKIYTPKSWSVFKNDTIFLITNLILQFYVKSRITKYRSGTVLYKVFKTHKKHLLLIYIGKLCDLKKLQIYKLSKMAILSFGSRITGFCLIFINLIKKQKINVKQTINVNLAFEFKI